ncbi:hypothetical protein [Mastigocladopsis repens]|uniref:hypothetical protein n=1 Tax=Mastigocladopsis repens TaxID=221287 RepID=UPI0018DEA662|nr:hypothetical protein [Mastigocladopsis repens]
MTSFFAVAFLGTLPALAELGTVWSDFQYYVSDFQNYLTNNISDTFNPVELQTQSAITNASGDLNIPNPNAATESVRDQIVQYSVSDKFENNPAVYSTTVSNEVNRYITRGAIEGLLGRDGQNRLKGKLEDTEKSVKDSSEFVQKADEKKQEKQTEIENLVSEDFFNKLLEKVKGTAEEISTGQASLESQQQVAKVIKLAWEGLSELELQNINVQREQTRIMGETLGNAIQMRNDFQYSNLNLADISQQMNEVNRVRRVETSAEVARLLRVTSQTDLFRKNPNSPSVESNPSSLEENPPSEETNLPSSDNNFPPLEPDEESR